MGELLTKREKQELSLPPAPTACHRSLPSYRYRILNSQRFPKVTRVSLGPPLVDG